MSESREIRIKVKPYKNKELRTLYEMDHNPKAWKKLMDKYRRFFGEPDGQFYDVNQVIIIFAKIGIPGMYLPDELEKIADETRNEAA